MQDVNSMAHEFSQVVPRPSRGCRSGRGRERKQGRDNAIDAALLQAGSGVLWLWAWVSC